MANSHTIVSIAKDRDHVIKSKKTALFWKEHSLTVLDQKKGRMTQLEQINFKKVYLLCKDLSANPCHEMLVGELGLPLSKHFKVKMLYLDKRTILSNYQLIPSSSKCA